MGVCTCARYPMYSHKCVYVRVGFITFLHGRKVSGASFDMTHHVYICIYSLKCVYVRV